jgi:hypothetical protein
MTRRRGLFIAGLTVVIVLAVLAAARPGVRATAVSLPSQLNDREFWRLSQGFSEPNGYFRSDNLLSNELGFQTVIPELLQRNERGGAYLGVGPEQNFTYIAAVRPQLAFIPDIRRGNLDLQLLYKALFELSADRSEFVSRLFVRKRPEGARTRSTALEIFAGYAAVEPGGEEEYLAEINAVEQLLQDKHRFPLSSEDLSGIDYVYRNFYKFGPSITYDSSTGGRGRFRSSPSYADLMAATDGNGVNWSYLANEENFQFVKGLEERNLIVPIVGNLSGPKALREVGHYLKAHEGLVAAFYLSNVEEYLSDETWTIFCRNVAALPLDPRSTFIRSRGSFGRGLMSALGSIQSSTQDCDGASR